MFQTAAMRTSAPHDFPEGTCADALSNLEGCCDAVDFSCGTAYGTCGNRQTSCQAVTESADLNRIPIAARLKRCKHEYHWAIGQ